MSDKKSVILGGGIFGLSTAFYLAEGQNGDGSNIVILDPAKELLLNASGASNGWNGPPNEGDPVYDIMKLSNDLLEELARRFDGASRWSHRYGDTVILLPPGSNEEPIHDIPSWLPHMKEKGYTGKLHFRNLCHFYCFEFCQYLIQQCTAMGVTIMTSTQAISATTKDGVISSILARNVDSGAELTLLCNSLVISAGPWTPGVFKTLFPKSPLDILKRESILPEYWLNIRDPNWKLDQPTGEATQTLWHMVPEFNDTVLNISSYDNGVLWVSITKFLLRSSTEWFKINAFEGDPLGMLPSFPQPHMGSDEELEKLQSLAAKALGVDNVEVLRSGMAYYDALSVDHPITDMVPSEVLCGNEKFKGTDSHVYISMDGVYGLSCVLACGKWVSEKVLNKAVSVDMGYFAIPPHYIVKA